MTERTPNLLPNPRPNPMYLFSSYEAIILTDIYRSVHGVSEEGVLFSRLHCIFNEESLPDDTILQIREDMFTDADKIIYRALFPTTDQTPHHIHEDGSRENQSGRDGPIRTYFDGSYIENLGHAVAICIDRKGGTITTQCPNGYDLPEEGKEILESVCPTYQHITMKAQQQKDAHSCVPLTLYNMFAMAGIYLPQQTIDIQAWRSELLQVLKNFQIPHHSTFALDENGEKVRMSERVIERIHGRPDPVFHQRYVSP